MQKGTLDRQYLSTIEFMDKREILNKVLDLYDEEQTIVDVLDMTNRYVPTSQEIYHYHVNERLHRAATVASALPQPAAGAASNVALTAGSVKPRIGDLMITGGRVRSYVSAVNGNTITVKPVNEDNVAHEAFLGNEQVTFFSNGYGEGTGVEDGYIYGTKKYENNIQIIKGEFTVTDLQAMTQVEVEFKGKPYYFIKAQHDVFTRFKMDVAYAFLLGERSKGLVDANGKKVWTTHGLEKSVRQSGIDLPLRTDTNENFRADFKAITRALDKARGPQEYWLWAGANIDNAFDDFVGSLDELKAGGLVYNSFGNTNPKQKAVDLGFDSFRIYKRTWHKKRLDALDNPELTAATGHSYPDTVFMIPATKIKCNYDSEMKDRFRVRYLTPPAGEGINVVNSREYKEIRLGGLAPVATNAVMESQIVYNTWQGVEFLGLEHFAINSFQGQSGS